MIDIICTIVFKNALLEGNPAFKDADTPVIKLTSQNLSTKALPPSRQIASPLNINFQISPLMPDCFKVSVKKDTQPQLQFRIRLSNRSSKAKIYWVLPIPERVKQELSLSRLSIKS